MGLKLLVVVIASLILMVSIDLFIGWYEGYLRYRFSNDRIILQIKRLFWIILALLFWMNLSARRLLPSINVSHLLFVAFIFCIYGFLRTFYQKRDGDKK
ncbi:MAG: hypothetical protein GXO76_06945 [Calditrichaeota bacterium]|nr:hypothetical protein [Calditrichota bacterium]